MRQRCKEIHQKIQDMVQPAPSSPPEPASASSNPASASAPMEAPADAGGAASGGGSSDEPMLFGRSTVTLTSANVDDKTSFFANIDEGPKLDTKEDTHVQLFETGVQGVLPVAALVKILQGFQEELQNQVAVLFSSCLAYKLTHKSQVMCFVVCASVCFVTFILSLATKAC